MRQVHRWFKFMQVELDLPIELEIDNQPALIMRLDNCCIQRKKYLDAGFMNVRDKLHNDLTGVCYSQTADITADILAK
eukprot:snap_masked-scaffold_1-processed-gene-16.78-mRNA-1 protein AED:1.00 eAED:1.00 QI:0/-1/0/0/-1/1/1/0/77